MSVKVQCVWEHNENDTLLYAVNFPGAYTRGADLDTAIGKMAAEVCAYMAWQESAIPDKYTVEVIQNVPTSLDVCDADSDVLFFSEQKPMTMEEYEKLKTLALKSAEDFHALYQSIPQKDCAVAPTRKTFYGQVPRTAQEMYLHTKNINAYYFGEIDVAADNDGTIVECRRRGFAELERQSNFLANPVIEGSYGEKWTLRKVFRRFLWHDRIHGKAMYRMAVKLFGADNIPDVFCFRDII